MRDNAWLDVFKKKICLVIVFVLVASGIKAQDNEMPDSDALVAPQTTVQKLLLPSIQLPSPQLRPTGQGQRSFFNLTQNQANDARTLAMINKDASQLVHASAIAVASIALTEASIEQAASSANKATITLQSAPVSTTTTTIAKPIVSTVRIPSTTNSTTTSTVARQKPIVRVSTTTSTLPQAVSHVKDPVPSPAAIRAKALEAINYAQAETSRLQDAPLAEKLPSPLTSLAPIQQTIFGQLGMPVEFGLKGRGWLYLGAIGQENSVAFLEKSADLEAEKFKFRNQKTGMVTLQFQRQDIQSGLTEKASVVLTISPRLSSAVLPINSSIQNSQLPKQSQTNPISNTSGGQFEPEYPSVSSLAGNTQIRSSSNWSMPRTDIDQNTTSTTVNQAHQAKLSPETQTVMDASSIDADAASMFGIASSWEKSKNLSAARDLYTRILKEHAAYEKTDAVMFALAKLLESDASVRDLKASRDLYIQLQNQYPYSSFLEAARDRTRYLQRTFFRQ